MLLIESSALAQSYSQVEQLNGFACSRCSQKQEISSSLIVNLQDRHASWKVLLRLGGLSQAQVRHVLNGSGGAVEDESNLDRTLQRLCQQIRIATLELGKKTLT